MKRYLFFACDCYEPLGGWGDFIGSFDAINEIFVYAKATHEKKNLHALLYKENNFQVVDLVTGDFVLCGKVGDIIDGKVVDIPT